MTQTEIPSTPPAAGRPTFSQSIAAYFRLWRYEARGLVLCFLLMYLGWIALAGGFEPSAGATAGGIAAATAAATCLLLSAFLINDAADRDIDRLVHPERPIPQGRSAWQHVYGFGAFLLAAGVGLGTLVNARFAAAAALLAVLLALHYGYLKRRLPLPCSSELIAPLVSALFPLTAFAAVPQLRLDVLLAVMTFIYFADLAHDILGGIHDREGDRRQNVRTFALAVGNAAAARISAASFLVCVAAGWMVYVLGPLGWLYLATFGVFTLVALYHYGRVFLADETALAGAAGQANHFGGIYFFVVSGSILPDYAISRWLG